MVIPYEYVSLTVNGLVYGLEHLGAFCTTMPAKGRVSGADLRIEIVFSTHVFTKRAMHGASAHIFDHHGTGRVFGAERYEMSKRLPTIICDKIKGDALAHTSKSYGGVDNLITVEDAEGRNWAIVFCFHSMDQGVRMEILSAHPKVIQEAKIRRANLSLFARRCLFEGGRIPKT